MQTKYCLKSRKENDMEMIIETNEYGRKFLRTYKEYINSTFLGFEETNNPVRKEIAVFVKNNETNQINVLIIPNKCSINKGCCHFGTLEYYADAKAFELAGINPQYHCGTDWYIDPKWYLSHDDPRLDKYYQIKKETIETWNAKK